MLGPELASIRASKTQTRCASLYSLITPSSLCYASTPHPTLPPNRRKKLQTPIRNKFWCVFFPSLGVAPEVKGADLQRPRRLRPGTGTQGRGLGQLTLLTVSPGEACATGTLAADVVTAGAILTLAHAPTVLPIKSCWAAWRNRVGATLEVQLGLNRLSPATSQLSGVNSETMHLSHLCTLNPHTEGVGNPLDKSALEPEARLVTWLCSRRSLFTLGLTVQKEGLVFVIAEIPYGPNLPGFWTHQPLNPAMLPLILEVGVSYSPLAASFLSPLQA